MPTVACNRVIDEADFGHLGRNLKEEIKPFAGHRVRHVGDAGYEAARVGDILNQSVRDRINYSNKHNRFAWRGIPNVDRVSGRATDKDVGVHRSEFGSIDKR